MKRLHAEVDLGLHLGAGQKQIEGLVNCDLYNPDADRQVDATALTEFSDESVDLIEHHHMVEHLSFEDFEKAMRESKRVLRPGGYLIMTCPDILRLSLHYVGLRLRGLVTDVDADIEYAIKMFVGSQEHEGMYHKNHFDSKRMRVLLQSYGLPVIFSYPYPRRRTPSMLVVARKE